VASGAMAVMALVLVTAGCAQATPAARAAISVPVSGGLSWQVVKRVPGLSDLGFSAVVAVGKNGGWAFDTAAKPTAWERNGSNPNAWTQVPFPGLAGETVVCAVATSATNVWAFTSDFGKSRALRWNGTDWTVVRSFDQAISGAVVLSPSDVWVLGEPYYPGAGMGAWHYDGRTWSAPASGRRLEGGSALSGDDIWAFDGTDVAHWNGTAWSWTSVAALLPAKQFLNDSVGDRHLRAVPRQRLRHRQRQPAGRGRPAGHPALERPPVVQGGGRQLRRRHDPADQLGRPRRLLVADAGVHGAEDLPAALLRRPPDRGAAAGRPDKILVNAVALIPGTTSVLAGGDTHAAGNPGIDVVAAVLQYRT
jgi:hypothetical protein